MCIRDRYQAAIEDYNQALAIDRQRGVFLMQRGLAYKNMGNKTQAAADLRLAQETGTNVPANYWSGLQ